MHRIKRDDLYHHVCGTIRAMRTGKGGRGKHPISELQDDFAVSTLAGRIVSLIDSESRMVISTEQKFQSYGTHGKWGIDEPWPEGCEPK